MRYKPLLKLVYRFLLVFAILAVFLSVAQAQLSNGDYIIRNKYECPNHAWCNAELSWDASSPHPIASIEFNDRVEWEITAISGKSNHYIIRSKYGCPNHAWCNAELSWDASSPHPMASIEFNDRVEWEITAISGKPNHYIIRSKYGCPNHVWCNAELSWDASSPHPMASIEFNDRVEWEILSTNSAIVSHGSKIALRTFTGHYLVAEGGGGSTVNANRVEIGPWEVFEVVDVGNGEIALRTNNGRYVVAEGGGGDALNADRVEIGPWERFKIINLRGNQVCLKTNNSHFVVAEDGGGSEANANRDRCKEWETFELIPH